jgi:hypothetical protein
VPTLTDAVRFRLDECSYFSKRVKGVALKAVAEAHLVLFRPVDVGESHHVLRAAGEIDQLG